MAVDTHGLEAIRKSANPITPGDNSDLYIATKVIEDITGSFAPSGLRTGWLITTLLVSATAIKIPTTAFTDRNSIEIHNLSSTYNLYIGPANTVTADAVAGTTSGKIIPPDSYWSIDITDAIDIYGICASGESALVQVMEVA